MSHTWVAPAVFFCVALLVLLQIVHLLWYWRLTNIPNQQHQPDQRYQQRWYPTQYRDRWTAQKQTCIHADVSSRWCQDDDGPATRKLSVTTLPENVLHRRIVSSPLSAEDSDEGGRETLLQEIRTLAMRSDIRPLLWNPSLLSRQSVGGADTLLCVGSITAAWFM